MVLEHAMRVVCWEVVNQSQEVLFSGQPLHVVCEHVTNCSYAAAHLMTTLGDFDRKMATCLCSDVIGHLPFAIQCPQYGHVNGSWGESWRPSLCSAAHAGHWRGLRQVWLWPLRRKQNTPALYLAECEWVQLQ